MSRALAAGLALVAGAATAGAAKANGVVYYYDDPPSLAYGYTAAPRVYYYSEPVIVTPAPRTYYESAPVYTMPAHTTYYFAPSNHDHYAPSAGAYAATPAPYGYVPPGLSLQTPVGTYAPFYGGWNSYSNEEVGGYDRYRTTADR
jgi:hypothetical protein